VTQRFGVTAEGNFEGVDPPSWPHGGGVARGGRGPARCWMRRATLSPWASGRRARQVVTAWNDLAIAALATPVALGREDYIDAAAPRRPSCWTLIVDGRCELPRRRAATWASSTIRRPLLRLLCLYGAPSPRWLAAARTSPGGWWVLRRPGNGGFFYVARTARRWWRARAGRDHPTPAGSRPRTCCCAWSTSPAAGWRSSPWGLRVVSADLLLLGLRHHAVVSATCVPPDRDHERRSTGPAGPPAGAGPSTLIVSWPPRRRRSLRPAQGGPVDGAPALRCRRFTCRAGHRWTLSAAWRP
jgi:hypothetical protein